MKNCKDIHGTEKYENLKIRYDYMLAVRTGKPNNKNDLPNLLSKASTLANR